MIKAETIVRLLPIMLWLVFLSCSTTVQATEPQSWEVKHQQLQHQRDLIFVQLEEIHSVLVLRAQDKDPDLLKLLSLDPPEPHATGYGLLPEILVNAAQAPVEPRQTYYSLRWIETRLNEVLGSVGELGSQIPDTTELEPLVALFEQLLKDLRNLESHLNYHKYWQNAVMEYPEYFSKHNELVILAREMNALIKSNGNSEQIANLRNQLLQKTAPFRPTPELKILRPDEQELVLPVLVCTDIEDSEFLSAFQTGVQEAFSLSPAAQSYRFSIELKWRLVRVSELYPDRSPSYGESVDINEHVALFKGCPLLLTTGASSTHAFVGTRIVLGTTPISPRTLAHEFGHLLGFEDAYVRGYDGDPASPYGVVIVEWTGLSSGLMGDSTRGQVSEDMINTLIKAYSQPALEY